MKKLEVQGIQPASIKPKKNQVGSALKIDDIANYRNVLNDAQRLLQEKEYSLTIVLVITAFEVFILSKVLIMHPSEEKNIQKVLSTDKFKEKLSSYFQATGKEGVKETKEWNNYCTIQRQRNAVVHLGRDFGQKEAVTALEQIKNLIELLQD